MQRVTASPALLTAALLNCSALPVNMPYTRAITIINFQILLSINVTSNGVYALSYIR